MVNAHSLLVQLAQEMDISLAIADGPSGGIHNEHVVFAKSN